MSILEEIFAHKRIEVGDAKHRLPEKELEFLAQQAATAPSFTAALIDQDHAAPRLIAEIKHRSPSKGVLTKDFDPIRLAKIYCQHGAAAISVLTDQYYFGGHLDHLRSIADLGLGIPLFRKDFIFERYQLLEARAAGASAALLIAAMLDDIQLKDLVSAANEMQLATLVEVHNEAEVAQALKADAAVIGINNRDLHTFDVNLETTMLLTSLLPKDTVLVSESGIRTAEDLDKLASIGIDAVLVGEALVNAADIPAKVRSLSRIAVR